MALCAINGCSNLGKSYSEIDPEGALADVRKHNGYFSLQSVTPGTAKLVMRSEGSSGTVEFSMRTFSDDCNNFKSLGSVKYSGRGVIYPWIADLTQSSKIPGFLSSELVPGQSVLIRGNGSWNSATSYGSGSNMTLVSSGKCGPLLSRFTPVAGHAYLVQFNWENNICKQNVFDATNPDAPVLVPSEAIVVCEKP